MVHPAAGRARCRRGWNARSGQGLGPACRTAGRRAAVPLRRDWAPGLGVGIWRRNWATTGQRQAPDAGPRRMGASRRQGQRRARGGVGAGFERALHMGGQGRSGAVRPGRRCAGSPGGLRRAALGWPLRAGLGELGGGSSGMILRCGPARLGMRAGPAGWPLGLALSGREGFPATPWRGPGIRAGAGAAFC